MTTANQLYARTPKSTSRELHKFWTYNHCFLSELTEIWQKDALENLESPHIEFKTLQNFCFDGERSWTLETVWYLDKPVMIVQSAGRGGADHYDQFITNKPVYDAMISYLLCLIPKHDVSACDVIDPCKPRMDLDYFYNQGLDEPFEHD